MLTAHGELHGAGKYDPPLRTMMVPRDHHAALGLHEHYQPAIALDDPAVQSIEYPLRLGQVIDERRKARMSRCVGEPQRRYAGIHATSRIVFVGFSRLNTARMGSPISGLPALR